MPLKTPENFNSPEGLAWIVSRAVIVLIALVVMIGLSSSFVVIQPGYTGVIFNVWTGSLRTVGQGMAFRLPFISFW